MFRILLLVTIAFTYFGSACAQNLISETFQDGDTHGWGGNPGRGDIRLSEYSGNISLRLRRNAAAVTRLSVTPGDYQVSVDFAADNLEGNDGCVLEVSVSNAEWIELGRISDGPDDAVSLHTVSGTIEVPGDQMSIQLRADANANNDTCWADNIRVTKIPGPENGMAIEPDLLLRGMPPAEPFSMRHFAPSDQADKSDGQLNGTLTLQLDMARAATRIVHDRFGFDTGGDTPLGSLPDLATAVVQDGGRLLPVKRSLTLTDNHHWDYILTPGRVWREPEDGAWNRAALPFALIEKNSNCVHNGVLTFGFKADGSVTPAAWQIGSETCAYFQFDAWGSAHIDYTPGEIAPAKTIKQRDRTERAKRLPIQPISALAEAYPGIDTSAFASSEDVRPESMTLFGLVAEGTHYVGGCETRYGTYPYCDEMVIPSYSFAKTLFGGLGLMRLEKLYPGAMQAQISDYVPSCKALGTWDGVTFENALDMATGHYQSVEPEADENAAIDQQFFLADRHREKIDLACGQYPHRSAPGQQWVYHTSDTYLLGVAMQAFLKAREGPEADIYQNLLVQPVWKPLGLSATLDETRRTNDASAQPFTGWGLFMQRGDLARLLDFLGRENGQIDGSDVFAPTQLSAAMQKVPEDRGLQAHSPPLRYNNGFWSFDIQDYGRCDRNVPIPFLSGFGGLAAVLIPNRTAYYYVSDGGAYSWARAAMATNEIAPFCEGAKP